MLRKKTKGILNGLQKSRNKFSLASKIKPHRMNIYLGPKCNFEKRAFFLNSNKIANKPNKILFDFLLNPQYFFILGKSFFSLSRIFVIEITEDKINQIKLSYFQNLRNSNMKIMKSPTLSVGL